jgi:ADP-ribose pyrophosphatase
MEIRLLDEEVLCRGRRVTLYSRRYWVEGKEVVRDVVHFGESVAIVPVKDDGKIILIRQFRASIGKWIIEVPAGRVEEGEDWRSAARRELEEETGYKPSSIERLASTYVSPGYSDEVIHITVARGLEYVGQNLEPTEVINVFETSVEEALEMILGSDTADAKTVIALMLYHNYVHGRKT